MSVNTFRWGPGVARTAVADGDDDDADACSETEVLTARSGASDASGHPGDIDAIGCTGQGMHCTPPLPSPPEVVDQIFVDGNLEQTERPNGPGGNWGILCGNWGGNWSKDNGQMQQHMDYDLKSCPCSILILQEAKPELLDHLRAPAVAGIPLDEITVGKTVRWRVRPTYKFVGIRGIEAKESVIICAKEGLARYLTMDLFRLREDGVYRPKKKTKSKVKPPKKMALSRILVVTCKMRFFNFQEPNQDSAGAGRALDELTIMSCHLHYMTAKKDVADGAKSLHGFWDEMAQAIVDYRVRVVGGDFNMAFWQVVPELRARGIQANLAAWYPFRVNFASKPNIDSMGIFLIGPCEGIRKMFGVDVLGENVPTTAEPAVAEKVRLAWRNAEQCVHDHGKVVARLPYELAQHGALGSGYPLSSYRPTVPDRIKEYLRWNFSPAIDWESPAVAEAQQAGQNRKELWCHAPDQTMGVNTFNFTPLPASLQKPIDFDMFDGGQGFLSKGSHMPVMVWMGKSSQARRGSDSQKRRAQKSAERGFDAQRIRRHAEAAVMPPRFNPASLQPGRSCAPELPTELAPVAPVPTLPPAVVRHVPWEIPPPVKAPPPMLNPPAEPTIAAPNPVSPWAPAPAVVTAPKSGAGGQAVVTASLLKVDTAMYPIFAQLNMTAPAPVDATMVPQARAVPVQKHAAKVARVGDIGASPAPPPPTRPPPIPGLELVRFPAPQQHLSPPPSPRQELTPHQELTPLPTPRMDPPAKAPPPTPPSVSPRAPAAPAEAVSSAVADVGNTEMSPVTEASPAMSPVAGVGDMPKNEDVPPEHFSSVTPVQDAGPDADLHLFDLNGMD